jgi:hypothetical protein
MLFPKNFNLSMVFFLFFKKRAKQKIVIVTI